MPFAEHACELRRTPVDELGAPRNRHRSGTVSSSADAASNAPARFDDNDIETGDIETGIVQGAPQRLLPRCRR